jgi:hypothetical protein
MGAARDAAAVCKLARESLHRREASCTATRIRRQKQKGDAVQSVAGSVDTVNRKRKRPPAARFEAPGRHAAVWFRT